MSSVNVPSSEQQEGGTTPSPSGGQPPVAQTDAVTSVADGDRQVTPYASGDEQLDDFLGYLMLCLKRYIARYGYRLIDATGTLSNLYVSLCESEMVLNQQETAAIRERWGEQLNWPAESDVAAEIGEHLEKMDRRRAVTRASGGLDRLPLEALKERAGLSQRQLLLLVAALGPVISVDVARLYTFAWADFAIKRPTVGFLAELIAEKPGDVRDLMVDLSENSPLVRHRLVLLGTSAASDRLTPLLHQPVHVPQRVVTYLLGHPLGSIERSHDGCQLDLPASALDPRLLVLPAETLATLSSALDHAIQHSHRRPRLLLLGMSGAGRRTALHSLAAVHGIGLLTVNLSYLPQEPELFETQLAEICREALLRGVMLLIRGDQAFSDREQTQQVARPLMRILGPYEGLLALTARSHTPLLAGVVGDLFEITFPPVQAADQRNLWKRAIEELHCSAEEQAPAILTQRMSVSPGQIYQAVAEARSRSLVTHGEQQRPRLRIEEITQAVRRRADHTLGTIAQPYSTTLNWTDVILPDDVFLRLREILAHARYREKVYDQWEFRQKISYGHGLSCLFSGPPGTGKTMMAAILAKELGREIFRVDLSRVVSKWIGETEKNLAIAFDEAEKGQVILLFDEADSLFSKRTKTESAQDRFANMEVNYLLQRMENYDGMTILTTNKEKAIDEAFKRRLKFRINFPIPEMALREKLWRSMITSKVRLAPDIDFEFLAKKFEVTGGHIRNAVLRAAFYAAEEGEVITFDHLWRAALIEAREMGMAVRDEFAGEDS
ncbi:MAG: ATP-binding protein [Bradymonadales bacterium]|nr:ATP-binding protein [Bradymonadales bacterium]